MTRRQLLQTLPSMAIPALLRAQDEWQHDVEMMLSEFLMCKDPIDDQSPCNYFLGRALHRIYGISDFNQPGHDDQYMSANEIATALMLSDNWTPLGKANSQNALNQAKGYADLKKAIVAAMTGTAHGHVAIILPGPLVHSNSWNLDVPNSASFFLNKPQQSYIGKPLSFAFQSNVLDQVTIYGRNS